MSFTKCAAALVAMLTAVAGACAQTSAKGHVASNVTRADADLLPARRVREQLLSPPLFKADRPLSTAEVARVLEASHAAMSGKTFRVTPADSVSGPLHEVQMGPAGWPRYVRSTSNSLITVGSSRSFTE